jgi:hypothetical protein
MEGSKFLVVPKWFLQKTGCIRKYLSEIWSSKNLKSLSSSQKLQIPIYLYQNKSGFVKRNETEKIWNETKRNEKKMSRSWNETERNGNETERNFCETMKTNRKENRITFLIRFKFRERFSFQLLIFKSKVLFSDYITSYVFVFLFFSHFLLCYSKFLSHYEKISKIAKLA